MDLKKWISRLFGKKPAEPAAPTEPPRPSAGEEPPPAAASSASASPAKPAQGPEPGREQITLAEAREKAARELARYDAIARSGQPSPPEQEFLKYMRAQPEQVRALVAYELARRGPSQGWSGFHMAGAGGVFWPCGWAHTRPVEGVAFGIWHACFAGRDPLLFYLYDRQLRSGSVPMEEVPEGSEPPGMGNASYWIREVYPTIEGYSSGIRLVEHRGSIILFRLDASRVKKLDILYGGPGAVEQPDYVFTWPGAGEFQCTLGEVIDGQLVPLHLDDFCMK